MPTYKDLLINLRALDEEHLNKNITIYNKTEDEYFMVEDLEMSEKDCDVVDEGHLLLVFNCACNIL